jgi:hypothetical protein
LRLDQKKIRTTGQLSDPELSSVICFSRRTNDESRRVANDKSPNGQHFGPDERDIEIINNRPPYGRWTLQFYRNIVAPLSSAQGDLRSKFGIHTALFECAIKVAEATRENAIVTRCGEAIEDKPTLAVSDLRQSPTIRRQAADVEERYDSTLERLGGCAVSHHAADCTGRGLCRSCRCLGQLSANGN